MKAEFPQVLVVALHDDVFVIGPSVAVLQTLGRLLSLALDTCGLTPSGHKFKLFVPSALVATLAVADLEQLIFDWTPVAFRTQAHACKAHSLGFVAAGIPVGLLLLLLNTCAPCWPSTKQL